MDTRSEHVSGMSAPPRSVLVTQLLAGVVFLGIAWIHLGPGDPTGWDRFIGGGAALVSGLNLGSAGSLHFRSRTVRRQMTARHPGPE